MVVVGDVEGVVRWSRCLLYACVGTMRVSWRVVKGDGWAGGVEPLRLVFRVRDCVLLLLGEYSRKP